MSEVLALRPKADYHVAMLNNLAAMGAALEQASTVIEANAVADTSKAIERWARRRKANRPVLIQAMQYQRRAERKIGQLLPAASKKNAGRGRKLESNLLISGLASLSKYTVARCRDIAKCSDKTFEDWIEKTIATEDAEPTQSDAARLHLGAHVGNNSGNSEWYTPQEFVDAAREVMGVIHIDPCSCKAANSVVRAETFYDESDNGLSKEWYGSVFINPPYGDGTVNEFAAKLLAELAAGRTVQAIFLANNCTETKWFQSLISQASAVCFPQGRICFWSLEKHSKSPLQGQCVMYFGRNRKRFKSAFLGMGFCTYIQ